MNFIDRLRYLKIYHEKISCFCHLTLKIYAIYLENDNRDFSMIRKCLFRGY